MTPADAAVHESAIEAAMASGNSVRAGALASTYIDEAGEAPGEPAIGLGADPWFRSRYIGAGVALREGRPSIAARRLLDLGTRWGELPGALGQRVCLIAAEAQARVGNRVDARRWLGRLRPPVDLAAEPRLGLTEVRTRLILGDIEPVSLPVQECRRALERAGDLANLAILEGELARVWESRGDLSQALEALDRTLASRRPGGLPDAVAVDLLLQAARIAHARGDWQGALDRLDEAQGRSARGSLAAIETSMRRAMVLVGIGRRDSARSLWDEVRAGLVAGPPEELAGLAAIVAAVVGDDLEGELTSAEAEGFRLGFRGEIEAARLAYERAWRETSDEARRARQALALGRLALAIGDRRESARWLDLARDLADRQGIAEVAWRAREALGEAAAWFDGDEQRARTWFEEALGLAETAAAGLRDPIDRAAYREGRLDINRRLLLASALRGDVDRSFDLLELARGRFLLELWRQGRGQDRGGPVAGSGEIDDLDRAIAEGEAAPDFDPIAMARMISRRDRLFERLLVDRTRSAGSKRAVPTPPTIAELSMSLPRNTSFVTAALIGDSLLVLTVEPGGRASVVVSREGGRVRDQLSRWRRQLSAQLARYTMGWPVGAAERQALDQCLEEIGGGPLGIALGRAIDSSVRLIWVPDGEFHGFPIAALRIGGRYLIETREVVQSFSAGMIVEGLRKRSSLLDRWRRRKVVILAGSHDHSLRFAPIEGAGVAAAWPVRQARPIDPASAQLRQSLHRELARAKVFHLACHAEADPARPLGSSAILPSGERLRAVDWLDEPVEGLPLLVLSACRSAEVGTIAGGEVFGLTCGALAAGVVAVVSGLWPLADREVLPIIWSFYRQRMSQDLASSLAMAQREALARPGGAGSPLFWSALTLHGRVDPPGRTFGWREASIRRRQARHEKFCRGLIADSS